MGWGTEICILKKHSGIFLSGDFSFEKPNRGGKSLFSAPISLAIIMVIRTSWLLVLKHCTPWPHHPHGYWWGQPLCLPLLPSALAYRENHIEMIGAGPSLTTAFIMTLPNDLGQYLSGALVSWLGRYTWKTSSKIEKMLAFILERWATSVRSESLGHLLSQYVQRNSSRCPYATSQNSTFS